MLAEAGIRVGVALAPILPGISDRPELLLDAVRAARDAGASKLWTELLYLRPGTREHFLETLARVWPGEARRLASLYDGRAHLPRDMNRANAEHVARLGLERPRSPGLPVEIDPEPPRLAKQLGLALDHEGDSSAA